MKEYLCTDYKTIDSMDRLLWLWRETRDQLGDAMSTLSFAEKSEDGDDSEQLRLRIDTIVGTLQYCIDEMVEKREQYVLSYHQYKEDEAREMNQEFEKSQ